ncbi:MAG: NAD(P)H-hydrate dehydratase [Planctomycetes bacterium]|nr:NAD(P)H-hydrate dehydratase [Planctomycetota bacterium]
MARRITELPEVPIRPPDGHKGTFGRILVVAGSRGMSGAACLAGLGALRGGAGLVYVAVPEIILPIVASAEPSYLTIPLPSDPETGALSEEAVRVVQTWIAGKDAVAVGPGLGVWPGTQHVVVWAAEHIVQPLVIDADGLNGLAERKDVLKKAAGPRVLTPHPGEFARLIGTDVRTIQSQREELAVRFAAEYGVVMVLKGHGTVVTDGDRVAVNPTGNAGMATGGSGDVLTGLVAALLGQGMSAFEAAQMGVYVHGLAGDLAAKELSQTALIASDLPRFLGHAWKEIQPRS